VTDVKSINRFEANLVRIARFVVGGLSAAQARPLLLQKCARPRCLSRAAVQLVQDTLAKGCVRLLARHGGWRRERFLRFNHIADGYLWQRTTLAELGLHFSRHTMEVLLWLTAENLEDNKASRRVFGETDLSPADVFVCYHVLAALQETHIGGGMGKRLGLARQSLCRLAFPGEFAHQALGPPTDFARWTKGVGGCILEALQDTLANYWVVLERGKCQLTHWQSLQALGRAQETVLTAYLDALEKAGRLDLARFLLMVAVELLAADDVGAAHWIGGLTSTGPRLADRAATHEAAFVVIRQLHRLQRWERQARSVGYFDDNYAASQLWKSDWEYWRGDQLCRRADVLLRELNLLAGEGTR
jgi:hypothetical protein